MEVFLVVDVQHDFLPGGALPVPDGHAVIPVLVQAAQKADLVIASRDWHPLGHIGFADWPFHCIEGTYGAQLHPEIDLIADVIISKGRNPNKEAYSAFEDTGLLSLLDGYTDVERVTVGGLATEYCVKATALDSLRHGYEVDVLVEGCRGIDPAMSEKALREIETAGGHVIWPQREARLPVEEPAPL